MLPNGNVKIRFFVPEAVAGGLTLGQTVTVRCSGCEAGLTAAVSYISPESEYTPPMIYSEEMRTKYVFMIEARPPSELASKVRPGLPVSVVLR
jgi:HlyD family secretion protein